MLMERSPSHLPPHLSLSLSAGALREIRINHAVKPVAKSQRAKVQARRHSFGILPLGPSVCPFLPADLYSAEAPKEAAPPARSERCDPRRGHARTSSIFTLHHSTLIPRIRRPSPRQLSLQVKGDKSITALLPPRGRGRLGGKQ
jgi:hypothetical protein